MIPRRTDMLVTRWGARFMGRRFPVSIGRSGMTAGKREGDGATPVGIWRLMGSGYRADRGLPHKAPFHVRAVGPRELWCDDPTHPDYNHDVCAPFAASHERLFRADRLYDRFILTDWNWPNAVPGKGSAIFVHNWRGPRKPTAGCLAFRPDHLLWILARWTPRSRIIVRG